MKHPPVREIKSDTKYSNIEISLRNKVLSVLLAAGMVASMPAATAFNVMADTTAEADTLVGDSTALAEHTDDYEKPDWQLSSDNKKITLTLVNRDIVDATGNVTTKADPHKNVTATFDINSKSLEKVQYADGTDASDKFERATVEIKNVTATCESAGTADVTASIVEVNANSQTEYTWTKTLQAQVPATGHDWEYTTGTWTFTKTKENAYKNNADEWSATYTYKCANNKTHLTTVNATVVPNGRDNATCADDGEEYYTVYVDIKEGDKTVRYYFYNSSTTDPVKATTSPYYFGVKDLANAGYSTTGQKVEKNGILIDQDKNDSAKTTTNAEAEKTYFVAPISKYYHDWSVDNWTWNTNYADKYYTDKDKKDYNYLKQAAKDNSWSAADHYLYGANGTTTSLNTVHGYLNDVTEVTATGADDAAKLDDLKKLANKGHAYGNVEFKNNDNWKNLTYVKLTCQNANDKHFEMHEGKETLDGPTTVYVPAYVKATVSDATCTADAKVTYNAYVFYDEDAAYAVGGIDAVEFYKTYQIGTDGVSYAHSSGKNIVDTKVDTWEGSATGHNYYVSGWTWSNDFSYVTINLVCGDKENPDNTKHMITVQSSQITKNADGTAKVVYTAKDAREYANVNWYGKDGYYLDQTKNPYGKEYTINALPLKNAGDVNNGKIVMTRLYNKTTGEHLYTSDPNEIKTLVNEYNWTNEGTAWNAPAVSNTPVYRMFNRVTGEHVYTKDLNEVNTLSKKDEWNNEGIAWYSDDNKTVPVYRQFNPKAATSKASHNYTTSTNEKKTLTSQYGWNDEGIGWYGV